MLNPTARSIEMAGALLLAALLAAPAAAAATADELKTQLERGQQALARNDIRGATEAFKQADRLADGRSAEALDGMAMAYSKSGHFGDGIKAARRGVEAAKTPELKARLDNSLGFALYQKFQAEHDKGALDESVSWFRKALEVSSGKATTVRYNLGIALLSQPAGTPGIDRPAGVAGRHSSAGAFAGAGTPGRSRDEEGVALLKDFLESQPDAAQAEHAKRLIADPRRARDVFAPDFSVVTLDGQPLSLDDLKGKVVLIDFWATWCAPCRASSPSLKRLAEKMKQKPFVLLGISVDRDGAKLHDYLAREGEGWPQFWDQSGQMTRIFHVSSFPTFLVLDGDGRIVYATRGWGSSRERELVSAVSRTVDRLPSAGPAKGGKS